VTEQLELAGITNAAVALWADYDADQRLDLFVGAREGASWLFHNEGGTFVDMSAGSGLLLEGEVRSAQWLDYDGDGRLDIHVMVADCSQLFRGLEGGFFEVTELPPASVIAGPLSEAGVRSLGDGAYPAAPPPEGVVGPNPENGPSGPIDGARPSWKSVPSTSSSSLPSSATLLGIPITCALSIRDQAIPGKCLEGSTTPVLGRLYPLSTNLFVAVSGNVGVGTTSPSAKLHVAGTARITDTLTLAPAGDQALSISTGSVYKSGALFIHTRGGYSSGSNAKNLGVGLWALSSAATYGGGDGNTAIGADALRYNTGGNGNVAAGQAAMRINTIGRYNTAIGWTALGGNNGDYNTASGARALSATSQGFFNTADGAFALRNNIADYNTASGGNALTSNTTGPNNTAIGFKALFLNTSGDSNTANGVQALNSNTIGFRNTASGSQALYSNTTGIGQIHCDSAPGQGTRFTLRFKTAAIQPTAAAR
jgi:hypothetical protein